MQQVVQYIFFFLIGTTLLNFLIAIGARAKTGNKEFNQLILYWVSLFITYAAVAALAESPTQIAFAFFFQFAPCFLVVEIIRKSKNLRMNWRAIFAFHAVGMISSSLFLTQTDLGFTLSLMPVIITTCVPFAIAGWQVLITRRHDTNWIEKGMGYLVLSAILNIFNYAFFRLDEKAAWWGWSVSIAQYQALSIFLPLLINHRRESNERKNLELALEKISGRTSESNSVEIDELYRSLELQIGQKEAYSRRLSETNRHLEEEREMNDILIKTISHDLANPLTVVSAYMDMMASGRISPEDHEKIQERMRQNIKSATEMISRIRTTIVSRSEADLVKVTPVNPKFAIQRLEMLFEERLKEKNQRLRVFSGEAEIRVLADENALVEHVLANLLSNAVKFSYVNSEIHLYVRDLGETVEIECRDFGVGINPTRSEKTRFMSTPGTKGEEGTGFGLIVCGYFLRKFGAELRVVPQSSGGQTGTSFIVVMKKALTTEERLQTPAANIFS